MSKKEIRIKELIQDYLLEEDLSIKRIPDKKLEFGFQFSFPPGTGQGKQVRGQMMAVIKPHHKNFIIITLGIQIGEVHVNALNSLPEEKKLQFFIELRKLFLIKELFFRIDIQNNRFEMNDQLFPSKSGYISKNSFFKSVRKVFNCATYSNLLLNDFCSGKVKPEDFDKSKGFEGPGFSLYS